MEADLFTDKHYMYTYLFSTVEFLISIMLKCFAEVGSAWTEQKSITLWVNKGFPPEQFAVHVQ
jgi:hypothetical protein